MGELGDNGFVPLLLIVQGVKIQIVQLMRLSSSKRAFSTFQPDYNHAAKAKGLLESIKQILVQISENLIGSPTIIATRCQDFPQLISNNQLEARQESWIGA